MTIRGPKEDVDRAKEQLLELANERQSFSFTTEIRVKAQHHEFLIGTNGKNIQKIHNSTGARVVFPTNTDEDGELITMIGKKEAIESAKQQLESSIREIDNITESEITVDPRYHKHFVPRRGEILIVAERLLVPVRLEQSSRGRIVCTGWPKINEGV